MGEQEQDAEIGRLHREHNANKTKLVAMESKMERLGKAFKSLAGHLVPNTDPYYNLEHAQEDVQGIAEFDFAAMMIFLEEYAQLRKSIYAQAERLGKV